jgi:hypothetical protein
MNDSSSIKYYKQYEFNNFTKKQSYNENVDNVEVIEWTYNNNEYLLDKHTNNVYDPDSEVVIGIREYDNTDDIWFIRNNY